MVFRQKISKTFYRKKKSNFKFQNRGYFRHTNPKLHQKLGITMVCGPTSCGKQVSMVISCGKLVSMLMLTKRIPMIMHTKMSFVC